MKSYFSKLNYSLANEDSNIERQHAVGYASALAVCGSGSRAFSLIHDQLKKLVIVDISQPQIEFAKFKWELIRCLSYQNYLQLMGYVTATLDLRETILRSATLSPSCRSYADSIPASSLQYGLIYSGRWEFILIRLGKIITRATLHSFRKNFLEENDRAAIWPRRRLKVLIGLIANSWVLNTFLYKGQMVKSSDLSLVDFLYKNFEDAFLNSEPKNSFFHQMLFLGRIEFSQGFPVDVTETVFSQIKNYEGEVQFHCLDLIKAVQQFDFQFGSFSNVPSYFTDHQNREFETELTKKFKGTCHKVIIRSFLKYREVINVDLRKKINSLASSSAQHQDRTGLYRFQIIENV